MRGLKINKQAKGRDIPLAPTPKFERSGDNGIYARGVVISDKDVKAHPEDFKYLKNK